MLLVCVHWLLVAGVLSAQPPFPAATGRVNDFAGVLDAAVEAEIDQLLADLERKTSSEVAVVVVGSLDGMSVDDYANRMFKAWGVGQATQDNGVLIVVAPREREMRIEVGYGLEGVLPDGLAGEIIRDQFTPRFRDDDYPGGIRDGVRRVVEVIERHQVLTPELARFDESSSTDAPVALLLPFFGLFVAIGFFLIGVGLRTRTAFPLLVEASSAACRCCCRWGSPSRYRCSPCFRSRWRWRCGAIAWAPARRCVTRSGQRARREAAELAVDGDVGHPFRGAEPT